LFALIVIFPNYHIITFHFMETFIKISQFLLSLSLLIVLHEMGHFAPAKWFKTRVEKFYLFFDAWGKKLLSWKRGETEYGIGWLPLGGYVKISGMVDESMDTEALKAPPQPWEFRSKPAWQRLIIMVGGVTVNFILGIVIFGMMLWHWGKTYLPNEQLKYGIQMDSVLLNEGLRHGDIVLKVGDRSFDRLDPYGFVQVAGLGKTPPAVTVRRDGRDTTIQMSADIADKIAKSGVLKKALMSPRTPFEIGQLAQPSLSIWAKIKRFFGSEPPDNRPPALKAGLQKRDQIVAVDNFPTPFYDQFQHIANQKQGQTVTLTVKRPLDSLRTRDTTLYLPLTFDPGKSTIGVMRESKRFFGEPKRQHYSLAQAIPSGWAESIDFLNTQIQAFAQMFRGKIKVQDSLGSLISIGNMFSGQWDWESFWHLTASLSIVLAFMNLLPIPALDGGYVMFLIWEVVTGRRVSDAFMEKAVTVGFFLLIGLMVFALGLDLMRFVF